MKTNGVNKAIIEVLCDSSQCTTHFGDTELGTYIGIGLVLLCLGCFVFLLGKAVD
jgi:hypothetical protein